MLYPAENILNWVNVWTLTRPAKVSFDFLNDVSDRDPGLRTNSFGEKHDLGPVNEPAKFFSIYYMDLQWMNNT